MTNPPHRYLMTYIMEPVLWREDQPTWPLTVRVELWEENEIGEKRRLEVREYQAPKPKP